MKSKEKNKFHIDIDGYFRIAVEAEEDLRKRYKDPRDAYIKWATHPDSSVRDLVNQYYWLIRSSFVLIEEQLVDRDKALEAFNAWRQSSLGMAISLVDYQLHNKIVPQPDWLHILRSELLVSIKDNFPGADEVSIRVLMEPRFTARAKPSGEITISSHTYAILKALNTSLILAAHQILDEKGKLATDRELRIDQLGRFSIPHYLFLHDFIPTASLPYRSFPSQVIYGEVVKLTNMQTNLIVAHEYAHFALGHTENVAKSKLDREKQEEDADRFSIRACLSMTEHVDHYQKHDVWNAYRFLYQHHVISEIVSNLLRGKNTDFENLEFEKRRTPLFTEFSNIQGEIGNYLEMAGTISLLTLKGRLIQMGCDYIRTVADTLVDAPSKKGIIEPWWKKLQNVNL